MLMINAQRQWVSWPEAGIKLLLSPMTLPQRKKYYAEATVTEPDPADPKGRKTRQRIDLDKVDELVARHHIHGWEGVVSPAGDGSTSPAECTDEAKVAFLRIEPANGFVYSKIQTLDLHLVKEIKAAGNA